MTLSNAEQLLCTKFNCFFLLNRILIKRRKLIKILNVRRINIKKDKKIWYNNKKDNPYGP